MNSRVIALLKCQFTFEETTHEAVIVDISLKGALISSKFLPPQQGHITITLQTPRLKKALILPGEVIRGDWTMSEHGRVGRFAIRFSHMPLDLIGLINKLSS